MLRSSVVYKAVNVTFPLQAQQEWLQFWFPKLNVTRNDKFSGISLDALMYITQELRLPGRVWPNDENKAGRVKLAQSG